MASGEWTTPSTSCATSAARTASRAAPRARASCSSTSRARRAASSTSGRATAGCSPAGHRSPEMTGVGLDFSEPMLAAARERFDDDERVELVEHDLDRAAAGAGRFDAVVSSFAIHHLEHERKRSLYGEVFDLLEPGGVFANFEHVASPSRRLHLAFFAAIGEPLEHEDPPTACSTSRPSSTGCASSASRTSTATGSGWRWRCWSASSRRSVSDAPGFSPSRPVAWVRERLSRAAPVAASPAREVERSRARSARPLAGEEPRCLRHRRLARAPPTGVSRRRPSWPSSASTSSAASRITPSRVRSRFRPRREGSSRSLPIFASFSVRQAIPQSSGMLSS